MKNKKFFIPLYIFLIAFILLINNLQIFEIYQMPNDFYSSYNDISLANENKIFGNLINLEFDKSELSTNVEDDKEGYITFKLFGLIPIKKVKIKLLPDEEVYVGGNPIGLTLHSEGVVVVSDSVINLENTEVNKNKVLKNGDIIVSINDNEIKSLNDIDKILENVKEENVNIEYIRDNKNYKKQLSLIKDKEGKYKLGVWVRDNFSGIGTLTFVRKNGLEYAALGHAVSNGNNSNIIAIKDGNLYYCSLVGITKGERNNPGELKCVFVKKDQTGSIEKNTKYGIYGYLDESNDLIDANVVANLGGRLGVKPGKAYIISNISGIREEYEIEIIKANYQSSCDDKSMIFRVKDKKLLDLTGGIVQGMSGSPIIQNDKIIGAVTHVFLSDPTKGYAVYCDWMLEQMDK